MRGFSALAGLLVGIITVCTGRVARKVATIFVHLNFTEY